MLLASHLWGTEKLEQQLSYPCDGMISQPNAALFRGVTINASPAIVFRWLCQLRVAPYSYDWIDNGGRQSPPQLTAGLEQLVVGQDVMRIFDLVDFEPNWHLTIRLKPGTTAVRTFGDIAVSYLITSKDQDRCRLLVKLIVKYPQGLKGSLMRTFLPWGDLLMMRRQLLTLKELAEETAASQG